MWVTYLGEAYLAVRRRAEASRVADRAVALARGRGEQAYEALALRLQAEIAATEEPPDVTNAASQYQEALRMAEICGMRPLVARCHLELGYLYTRAGDTTRAKASLSTAADAFRILDMPWPGDPSR